MYFVNSITFLAFSENLLKSEKNHNQASLKTTGDIQINPETLHLELIDTLMNCHNLQQDKMFCNPENLHDGGIMEVNQLRGYQYLTNYLLLNLHSKLINDVSAQSSKITKLEKALGIGWEDVNFQSYWWYEKISKFAKIIHLNSEKIETLQLEHLQTKKEISNMIQPQKSGETLENGTEMFAQEAIAALFMETNINRSGIDRMEKKCNENKAELDLCSKAVRDLQEKLDGPPTPVTKKRNTMMPAMNKDRLVKSERDSLARDLQILSSKVDKLEKEIARGSTSQLKSPRKDVSADTYWLQEKISTFSKFLNINTEKVDNMEAQCSKMKETMDTILAIPVKSYTCQCQNKTDVFLKEAIDTLFMETNIIKGKVDSVEKSQTGLIVAVDSCNLAIGKIHEKLDEISAKTKDELNQMWRLVNVINTKSNLESSQNNTDISNSRIPREKQPQIEEECEEKEEGSNVLHDINPNAASNVEDLCNDVLQLMQEKMPNATAIDDIYEEDDQSFPEFNINISEGNEKSLPDGEIRDMCMKNQAIIKDLHNEQKKHEQDIVNLKKNTISIQHVRERLHELSSKHNFDILCSNDTDEMINIGLDGLCHFAIQINDKVSEISNNILATDFNVSELSGKLLINMEEYQEDTEKNNEQFKLSFKRMEEFEIIINELRKDIHTCKQIMSNDFALFNDGNDDEEQESKECEETKVLPPNIIIHHSGFQSIPDDVKCNTNCLVPNFSNISYRNQSHIGDVKPSLVHGNSEFYRLVNSLEPMSMSTVDELRDLCSRKLALIKNSSKNKHSCEFSLED